MFSTSDFRLPIDSAVEIPSCLARNCIVTFYNFKMGHFHPPRYFGLSLLWKPIDGPGAVDYNESRLYLELNHVDISKT